MDKKRVRVNLVVDLLVDKNLDVKEAIAVGKYEEDITCGQEAIYLKTEDFEVEEYVDIQTEEL